MTEQKIREAYAAAVQKDIYLVNYHSFKTGYMALLNELVISGSIICGDKFAKHGVKYDLFEGFIDEVGYWDARGYELIPIYRLPEGVTKS